MNDTPSTNAIYGNAALRWNGYPVSQPVVLNGLNHVIRHVPQASAQGNVVLPMAVTYPTPQVAIPYFESIQPLIRPCWMRPVATVHKQTSVLPLSVSTAGAASTIGRHSASPLPPSSACAPRSYRFPLNQTTADTVSASASCQQENSGYHAMKSEAGVCARPVRRHLCNPLLLHWYRWCTRKWMSASPLRVVDLLSLNQS